MIFEYLFFTVLLVIAYKDVRERRIPNVFLGVMLVCVFLHRIWGTESVSALSAMAGGISIALFFLLLIWLRPGAFGFGDVKLMSLAGIHLGIQRVWLAFAIGVVSAAIICVIGLLIKKISMKSAIPFGPFLCMGIAIALVL